MLGRFHGRRGEEVNIGNQGNIKPGRSYFLGNFPECFGRTNIGCGDTDNFTTRFG